VQLQQSQNTRLQHAQAASCNNTSLSLQQTSQRTFPSCFLLLQAHAAGPWACLIILILILLLLLILQAHPVFNKQQPIIFIAVCCCLSLAAKRSGAQQGAWSETSLPCCIR
jgi:MFS superfamily sulfate permease-like transporter